jgi:transposase
MPEIGTSSSMSGDGKRSDATWPQLPRPSSTLPYGFVATKTPEQKSCLMLHRTRHLFFRQQTAVINAICAHLAEFGIVAPVQRNGVEELPGVVADPSDKRLPEVAHACLAV